MLHGGATSAFLEVTAIVELAWATLWADLEAGRIDPDIAETMLWVATLPPHFAVNTLELMPVNQANGPFAVHREG